MDSTRKRCFTDIKSGSIFLLRRLYFGYLKTKAFLVICLTKQGQYALLYKDKSRREQLGFFNLKNCVIKRCTDGENRFTVEFRCSNTSRVIRFETKDATETGSWAQAFTGRQEKMPGGKNRPPTKPTNTTAAENTSRRKDIHVVRYDSYYEKNGGSGRDITTNNTI